MYSIVGRNYRELLYSALQLLQAQGQEYAPRHMVTSEVEGVVMQVTNPRDRVPLLKGRNANIFALIAETLWVFGGRNDLEFIRYYLNRISDFSADGKILEGGYGPRLRNWLGVDQVSAVVSLLQQDPSSRRAVIVLFDPTKDLEPNRKDIPCNNWIQFMIRNNELNMYVVSRSMDIIWGSTLNFFEWTCLQELVAYWLKVPIGTYTHFAGSLHVYDGFKERLQNILNHPVNEEAYKHIPIDIPKERFDIELNKVLKSAEEMRNLHEPDYQGLDSLWLRICTTLLWSYALHKNKMYERAWEALQSLPDSDLKEAGIDFYSRHSGYTSFIR